MVRGSSAKAANRVARPFFCGKKPSNVNRSQGNPEATNAGTKAVAPGRHCTVTPRATQALTNINPGSEMPGVPASDMSAITSPAAIRAAKASAVWCSLNLWCDTNWFLISKCLSNMPEVRVSSAKITSASFSMRRARSVMSSRLPTGVGTK